jgi:hypothetical protein
MSLVCAQAIRFRTIHNTHGARVPRSITPDTQKECFGFQAVMAARDAGTLYMSAQGHARAA